MGSTPDAVKLTVSQLQDLGAVYALETPTLSELAQQLALTKASVTAGIDSGYR